MTDEPSGAYTFHTLYILCSAHNHSTLYRSVCISYINLNMVYMLDFAIAFYTLCVFRCIQSVRLLLQLEAKQLDPYLGLKP